MASPSNFLPVIYAAFGIQLGGFLIAAPLQTDKFYDLTGALTFATCVGLSLRLSRPGLNFTNALSLLHTRQIFTSLATTIWCTRLGSFLFARVQRDGKDSRFDQIKKDPKRFAVAWFLQGVWVSLTAYPVFYLNSFPAAALPRLGWIDLLGMSLWLFGFAIEVIADSQKQTWSAKVGEKGRKTQFIDVGLWSLSRHPNYFGEITLWLGNAIICASAFYATGPLRALSFLVSPLLTFGLLTRVSGIPMLEKASDKRYGELKAYQDYKTRVPVLFPDLTLLGSSKKKE